MRDRLTDEPEETIEEEVPPDRWSGVREFGWAMLLLAGIVIIGIAGFGIGKKYGFDQGFADAPTHFETIEHVVFYPVEVSEVTTRTVLVDRPVVVERCTRHHRHHHRPWPVVDYPDGAEWLNGQEYKLLTDQAW